MIVLGVELIWLFFKIETDLLEFDMTGFRIKSEIGSFDDLLVEFFLLIVFLYLSL